MEYRKSKEFFNKLYGGLGYEYLTASLLWSQGYEAYKMPPDFGFDLLAYNARERTFELQKQRTPYLFQVKSWKIFNAKSSESSAGVRKLAIAEFIFDKNDLINLINEEDAYLVCYLIDCTGKEENVLASFWLNNKQLNYLYKGNNPMNSKTWTWFDEYNKDDSCMVLTAQVRTQADLKSKIADKMSLLEESINKLDSIVKDTKAVKEIQKIIQLREVLCAWIDRSNLTNSNSETYISLLGKSGIDRFHKVLDRNQLNFKKFNDTTVSECPFIPEKPYLNLPSGEIRRLMSE